jgi:hypothetical protein
LPLDPDPGFGFPIRILIHKVTKSGSNPETDPQPCLNVFTTVQCTVKSPLTFIDENILEKVEISALIANF